MAENRATWAETWAEWRSGWSVVLAAAIGFSFFSVMLAAVSVFMGPLGSEFHWTRTQLSAGVSIATVLTAVLSPFCGLLIDRFGSRRIALPGLLLTIGVIAAFCLNNGSLFLWFLLWSGFGVFSTSIKSTVWTAGVVSLFDKSRGLALGLVLTGTALSQIIAPPLTNWLIESYGWRIAYVAMALGWGGLTFLLVLLLFSDSHHRAATKRATEASAAVDPLDAPGLTRSQAVRDWALWRVAISNFLVMVATQGFLIHQILILTDAGVSRASAAGLASLAGVAGIFGKLITGQMMDRYRPNWIGGIVLGGAALAFFLLIDGIRSPTLVVVAMLVNGYAFGTKTQITAHLSASYGGMKNFGFIYGIMSALMALAAAVGPLVAGRLYDTTHSYGQFLLFGGIACAIGGLMMVSLPAYPAWKKEELTPATA